jgi:hypothetical protein
VQKLLEYFGINIGGYHADISWISPSAIPVIMGVELQNLMDGEELSFKTADDVIQVLEKMMNPVSEMTMLKGVNDALINFDSDNDVSGLAGIADTVIKSYISQIFPTLGNQFNRLIDPVIRSTTASKNSVFKAGESLIRQNINKIPFLSQMLEPSLDVWGNVRKRSDNAVLRGLDAFINPANITKDTSTDVDHEIMRIYDSTGSTDAIPSTPNSYFTSNGTKYEMSASEHTQYKMTYGQTAYQNLEKLFSSPEYKDMPDVDKEKAIKKVYEEATSEAKYEYLTSKYGMEEGLSRLLNESKLAKYNKAHETLGLDYSSYMKIYYAQNSFSKKTEKINAIMQADPKLSQQQATQLYRIFTGNL